MKNSSEKNSSLFKEVNWNLVCMHKLLCLIDTIMEITISSPRKTWRRYWLWCCVVLVADGDWW